MKEKTINIISHKDEVLNELSRKINLALNAIGAKAEEYAKKDCPVDTGRLRNSITYATNTYAGTGSYTDKNGNHYNDATGFSTPSEGEVYIGTNVEYAKIVEYNDRANHPSGKAHFLRDSATTHGKEYKKIVQQILEE